MADRMEKATEETGRQTEGMDAQGQAVHESGSGSTSNKAGAVIAIILAGLFVVFIIYFVGLFSEGDAIEVEGSVKETIQAVEKDLDRSATATIEKVEMIRINEIEENGTIIRWLTLSYDYGNQGDVFFEFRDRQKVLRDTITATQLLNTFVQRNDIQLGATK